MTDHIEELIIETIRRTDWRDVTPSVIESSVCDSCALEEIADHFDVDMEDARQIVHDLMDTELVAVHLSDAVTDGAAKESLERDPFRFYGISKPNFYGV